MKTDNAALVGKHAFEVAGLGTAPFRFVGLSDNLVTYPDGSSKPGGSCAYCGTGIRYECHVRGADGREFKVGCDCIRKAGDLGLLKAYKTSPEYRRQQRDLANAKGIATAKELRALIEAKADVLRAMPHPQGFTDRQTGAPLTAYDQADWMARNCGRSGSISYLKHLRKILA